ENAPIGSSLNPDTGYFEWTPGYTQHGEYLVDFFAVGADGAESKATTRINVLNVQGPLSIVPPAQLIVDQGQTVNFRVEATDPNHPVVLPTFTPDGTTDSLGNSAPLTWTHTALPDGAIFDEPSQTFYWTPSSKQAGTYKIEFDVADDGDGTG